MREVEWISTHRGAGKHLRKSRGRRENNINIDHRGTSRDDVRWMKLAQECVQWWALTFAMFDSANYQVLNCHISIPVKVFVSKLLMCASYTIFRHASDVAANFICCLYLAFTLSSHTVRNCHEHLGLAIKVVGVELRCRQRQHLARSVRQRTGVWWRRTHWSSG
jgi:hypothetical protein